MAGIAVTVLAFFAATARRTDEELDSERAKLRWLSTLDSQISPLLQMIAELGNTTSKKERDKAAGKVRTSAVHATSQLCGAEGMSGTRANLFRLEKDGAGGLRMRLEPQGWAGRGEKSSRVFGGDDLTLKYTLEDDFRFDENTSDKSLAYETFLTFPVSEGPEAVFGALTIDCVRSGDISQAEDIRIMQAMAAIISITYLIEKAPSYTVQDHNPVP